MTAPESVPLPVDPLDVDAQPEPLLQGLLDGLAPVADGLVEEIEDVVGVEEVVEDVVEDEEVVELQDPPVIDPWAHAFAESSRHGGIHVPPVYPVVLNDDVLRHLDRFTGSRRDAVTLWAGRAGRYLEMIREVLRSKGLPEELAYTAMIESGYNPFAVSRAGAKGLWQFMAATARQYGLRVDKWIDERFDPEKSTVAAAAYLKDLHRLFGSWPLAQAAYNAGEVRVARAIRQTGSTDFWILARSRHLHRETKEFVPKIQAATVIAQDPERYGIDFPPHEPVAMETVKVPPATSLRRVAAATGIPMETLRHMNPTLVRGVTPPRTSWKIRIPEGRRDAVLAAIAPPSRRPMVARPVSASVVRAARPASGIHVVRPRDTVSGIAKRYGVSTRDVLRWNGLDEPRRIRPGDRLRVTDFRSTGERAGAR